MALDDLMGSLILPDDERAPILGTAGELAFLERDKLFQLGLGVRSLGRSCSPKSERGRVSRAEGTDLDGELAEVGKDVEVRSDTICRSISWARCQSGVTYCST